MNTYAEVFRNSAGPAFYPETGELWFTDNGRDGMGDDQPECEFNHAPEQGMRVGFACCQQGILLVSGNKANMIQRASYAGE